MNEVSLDPRQASARAELLLAADFGRQARGRPIHGRLESEDGGAVEPGPRLKIGAVRKRAGAPSSGKTAAHDAAHRHAADDLAVATILTTAYDIHPHHRRLRLRRRPHPRPTPARSPRCARKLRRHLRHNALMTAAHADLSRHVSTLCAPRH